MYRRTAQIAARVRRSRKAGLHILATLKEFCERYIEVSINIIPPLVGSVGKSASHGTRYSDCCESELAGIRKKASYTLFLASTAGRHIKHAWMNSNILTMAIGLASSDARCGPSASHETELRVLKWLVSLPLLHRSGFAIK